MAESESFLWGGGKGKFTERRNSREGETQWTSLTEWRKIPAWTAAVSNVPPFEYRKQSSRISLRGIVIICSFYRYFFGLFSKIFRGDKLFTLETGGSWSDKGYKGRNFGIFSSFERISYIFDYNFWKTRVKLEILSLVSLFVIGSYLFFIFHVLRMFYEQILLRIMRYIHSAKSVDFYLLFSLPGQ